MSVPLLCFGCDSPDNSDTISNVSSTAARSTYNFTFLLTGSSGQRT